MVKNIKLLTQIKEMKKTNFLLLLILLITPAVLLAVDKSGNKNEWKAKFTSKNFNVESRADRAEVAEGLIIKVFGLMSYFSYGKDIDSLTKFAEQHEAAIEKAALGSKDSFRQYIDSKNDPNYTLYTLITVLNETQLNLECILDKHSNFKKEILCWERVHYFLINDEDISSIILSLVDNKIDSIPENKRKELLIFNKKDPWSVYKSLGRYIQKKIVLPLLEINSQRS